MMRMVTTGTMTARQIDDAVDAIASMQLLDFPDIDAPLFRPGLKAGNSRAVAAGAVGCV